MFASTLSEETANYVSQFIQSACFMLAVVCFFTFLAKFLFLQVIELSRDVSLTQDALRTLSFFFKKFSQNESRVLMYSVESIAERTISAVFMSIQSESMLSSNVNHIADILFLFASKYPSQTRLVVFFIYSIDKKIYFIKIYIYTSQIYLFLQGCDSTAAWW